MPKKRPPRYDADFKRRAVEQVLNHQRPVAQVARQLHRSPQSINNWIEKYRNQIPLAASSILPDSPSKSIKTPGRTAFLPLQVVDGLPIPSDSKIEIVTKNGLTLRFPVDTPNATLIGVVRQLEVTSC